MKVFAQIVVLKACDIKDNFQRRWDSNWWCSSINDGSSALILMEESYAKAHGYDILGIVGDYAEVGCDPQYMGYAPFYAVEAT